MSALEVPAVIASSVNLLRFTEALARAGIVGRYDAERHLLVIEPAPARCFHCAGTGLDDDARCEPCGGIGHEDVHVARVQEKPQERPADAWRAYKMGESQP